MAQSKKSAPKRSGNPAKVAAERERRHRDRQIVVTREERHVWRVSGTDIERMVVQTDWENDEAVVYLQHRFERSGLNARLVEAGCVAGDEVRILGHAHSKHPFQFLGHIGTQGPGHLHGPDPRF